jgi:YgiT-type zinc finger domain-containing protein
MNTKSGPICGEHKTAKEWKQTTFEYNEEGVTVRVLDIDAWVCPVDGEASFTPETADELHRTVRAILEPARKARAQRSGLPPYVVSVGLGERANQAA